MMLCAVGAFQIWRGTSSRSRRLLAEFTCEDIELTFRVAQSSARGAVGTGSLCLPDSVGVTEGPDTVRKLVAQRERWQRVILETVWANRRMWFNRRYGTVGLLGVPFYVVSEMVAPVFEVLADRDARRGGVVGLIDWRESPCSRC